MSEISSSRPHYAIAGAGFSGAVLARELVTQTDCRVTIFEERNHTAGNCHTERDAATDVMIHTYGPHIFNTNAQHVWEYVQRFGVFQPYINRVKAVTPRGIFSMPVNLHTINQFFGKTFNPAEAREFVLSLGDSSIMEPANFEEQALKFLGADLYQAFFYGYTKKQWGCEPTELPASILKRLPVRFNYDDNYYNSRFQGIPRDGYSAVIDAILDHPQIEVRLSERFDPEGRHEFDHLFFTGPIDAYFGFKRGRLGYRTVSFERIDAEGDYQGNAVLNYPDAAVPFTRVHEHKHFAPWETHERTVAFREYSRETAVDDVPYYPKRLQGDMGLLSQYRDDAIALENVSFLGRLATYRYMDMEKVIGEALDFSAAFVQALSVKTKLPQFPNAEA
ncbi:MAG TPA: UDP-galactopyranose mutase [Chthoniobacterales bacterium]|jgi:UDP-galactopyranose mutase